VKLLASSTAQRDIVQTLAWYADVAPKVGFHFLDQYDAVLQRVSEAPRSFPEITHGLRRAMFRRLPYAVFFRIRPDRIEIVGCLHARRDPTIWQRR
jgi:plasmid stabilization system protein ParE